MKNCYLKNLMALSTLFVLVAATSQASNYELIIIGTLGGASVLHQIYMTVVRSKIIAFTVFFFLGAADCYFRWFS